MESEQRLKKRAVALVLGYNGAKFSGNQKNPDVRTVENELERVFWKLNLIQEWNQGDLKKVHWTRSSRTDKGVHALFSVVGFRMAYRHELLKPESGAAKLSPEEYTRNYEELLTVINNELSEDLRV